MSRSKKGSKPIGYEYWKSRPGPIDPGKKNKKITHGIERAQSKVSTKKEPIEPEYDEREWIPDERAIIHFMPNPMWPNTSACSPDPSDFGTFEPEEVNCKKCKEVLLEMVLKNKEK